MFVLIHNFTTCGATREKGPIQSQAPAGITIVGEGIQKFVIPAKGNYIIEATAASGLSSCESNLAGKAASVKGAFFLDKGSIIYVLVGQQGLTPHPNWGGAGGGGSYVAKNVLKSEYEFNIDNCYVEPLIVAGGGGGSGDCNSVYTPKNGGNGTCEELEDGGGTNYEETASGGAGFSVDAVKNKSKSFINGGTSSPYFDGGGTSYGAFGGGGNPDNAGGGGGGFRGGDSGIAGAAGLGGSSFNSGKPKSCQSGVHIGQGYVTIYLKSMFFTQAQLRDYLPSVIFYILLQNRC